MMSLDLEITGAALHDDGQTLRLELQLHNPSARTLHLYRTLRAIRHDPQTRTLEVQLSDRGLDEQQPLGNFVWPRLTSIDPGGSMTFGLTLPRVLSRVKPGQVTVRTPVIESLPAHEAEIVEIEVAWSGTPFYDDPRPNAGGPRRRLVAWAQGHARFRLVRDGADDPDGSEDPGGGSSA